MFGFTVKNGGIQALTDTWMTMNDPFCISCWKIFLKDIKHFNIIGCNVFMTIWMKFLKKLSFFDGSLREDGKCLTDTLMIPEWYLNEVFYFVFLWHLFQIKIL
mgnify:CR=1 FL=1